MKKFLLLVLSLSVLAVLSACSDSGSSSNNGGGTTGGAVQVPIGDVKALEGTYNIEFFYTNAQIAAISTNCSMVPTYVSSDVIQCKGTNESVTHKGQGTIQVLEDGSVKVQTKLQMNGGIFNDPNGTLGTELLNILLPNTYTFTDFKTIPASAISGNKINDPATGNSVTGTTGRNATTLITVDGTNGTVNGGSNTYEFTVLSDGTVVNTMVDKGVMEAAVVVRMKKVSDKVTPLEPNTAYETPVINNFNSEITYTQAN